MIDFIYIRAWARLIQAKPEWLEKQIEYARAEHPPKVSIYRDAYGQWVSLSTITSSQSRHILARHVQDIANEVEYSQISGNASMMSPISSKK